MIGRLPYTPANYETTVVGGVFFHFSAQELKSHREFVQQISQTALQVARESLSFVPSRQVHVCCYHNSEDAARALDRRVSPTMAMAPFSSSDCGLAIIHSPRLDPMNADDLRMQRILTHEFVHLFVSETSGSSKVLGDANTNMRVSAWLNEGIAEVVGLQSIAAEERLDRMVEEYLVAQKLYEFGMLSQWLDDIDNASRQFAFTHVTAAVEWLCRSHGIRTIFHQIQRIEEFFDPLDCCSPSCLAELATILD